MEDFRDVYRALEALMRAQAEADGDVYLPNLEPSGPVRYVLIAMEPSWGRWAGGSVASARAKVDAGFRNFTSSIDVEILHYCARRYLGSYHITDISKGAMPVGRAGLDRTQRYERWDALLQEEIALVGPSAHIIAIGDAVSRHLTRHGRPHSKIIHYSPLAGSARLAATRGREAEFEDVADLPRLTPSQRRLLFAYRTAFEAIAAASS